MEGIFIVPFHHQKLLNTSKLEKKLSIVLQTNDIFKLDLKLPVGNQGLIQKGTPETTSDMQVDPASAGLHPAPCSIRILDIKEIHQLRNLAANLQSFNIYLHVFLSMLVCPLHAP